ncbi:MAG: hypothetical protein AAGD07_13220 [Planctomycetota bacterium]
MDALKDAFSNGLAGYLLPRHLFFWLTISSVLSLGLPTVESQAANYRTQNFLVQADSPQMAQEVGQAAERYRDDLANYWTGKTLPPWPRPCPIRVMAGPGLAAQGVTTYNPAPVSDFQMEVVGSPERILDSVLPHEVTHTVLATHFGRPLPRWADEGICTTVEHVSERAKHEAKLREFLSTRRGIAMNRLFLLTEYPADVLPMYAQGYSVCRFLIEQQGPRAFVNFLTDYMRRPSWTANVKEHYGYDSLAELQQYWLSWVESGSGAVNQFVKAPSVTATPATTLAAVQPSDHRQAPLQQLASAGPATRSLGKGGKGSWYSRSEDASNSREPKSQLAYNEPETIETPPARMTMIPPSVLDSGRYSAAQPQPESVGGTWLR